MWKKTAVVQRFNSIGIVTDRFAKNTSVIDHHFAYWMVEAQRDFVREQLNTKPEIFTTRTMKQCATNTRVSSFLFQLQSRNCVFPLPLLP